MLDVAKVIKESSATGVQSSSDVDDLLINVLTAINENLGKDKRKDIQILDAVLS